MRKLVLLLVATVWLAGGAMAAELRDRVQQLARQSDLVIIATCESAQSSWDDTQRVIVTRTWLRSEHTFNGSVPEEPLVVQTLGGEIGEARMAASHGATLSAGENVALFLRRSAYGSYYVIWGGEDGKLPVSESATGERLIGSAPAVDVATFAKWLRTSGVGQ